jgi:hypothetical protein
MSDSHTSASTISAHGAGAESDHGGDHAKETVTITVNNVPVPIHRGRQTVAEIKTAGHVALADDLEQLIDKRLVPLADDGSVTIKGEEVFVSHPKDSSSSHDTLFAQDGCLTAED